MNARPSLVQSSPQRSDEHYRAATRKHLLFCLGKDQLCAPLAEVKEIVGVPAATPLPGTPPYVKGFINLRGRIITLVDLRQRLGTLEPSLDRSEGLGSRPCTIIVEQSGVIAGFIVDDVLEVLRVDESQFERNAGRAHSPMNHYITGVLKLTERPLILAINLPQLARETVGVSGESGLAGGCASAHG